MKQNYLVIIALVVFALVIGCTAEQQQPAPVQQALPGDPAGPVVTATPEPANTPVLVTYESAMQKPDQFVYSRGGEYYFQKKLFVCTEPNPTTIILWNKSANSDDFAHVVWCER